MGEEWEWGEFLALWEFYFSGKKRGRGKFPPRSTTVNLQQMYCSCFPYLFISYLNWFAVLWGIVNNAGVTSIGLIEWMLFEEFKQIADVNLWGLIDVTKTFLPLVKKAEGRVVNFSSMLGQDMKQKHSKKISQYIWFLLILQKLADALHWHCCRKSGLHLRGEPQGVQALYFVGNYMYKALLGKRNPVVNATIPLLKKQLPSWPYFWFHQYLHHGSYRCQSDRLLFPRTIQGLIFPRNHM